MPLYSYSCLKCGRVTDAMRKVDERHEPPECYMCGNLTKLIHTPVRGTVKNPATPPGTWRKS